MNSVAPFTPAAAASGHWMKLRLQKCRLLLPILLVLLGASGCTQQPQRPPETGTKHARHEVRRDLPAPPSEQVPEHVAPPPAYGNKVVMAYTRTQERCF